VGDSGIRNINDFITLNLDIVAYAQDFLRNLTDPLVLRAFYFECLQKLSVLDPTCGSGAFLFAALNILEPLYELCLDKMEEMVGQAFPPVHAGKVARASSLRIKYKDFVEELQRVERHPNRRHFIYKNIIVNNLYGVDIMAEAVEICKLRLFLKLVAETDDPDRVEPLPDIDFNIRAGNTLVGYATLAEVQQSLFGRAVLDRIRQVDIQLRAYRNCQTEIGISATALRKNKEHIRTLLAEIEDKLDRSLFSEYGARDLTDWKRTHQPFHWYVEFNSIIQAGGFDVIVGNPPYVELKDVTDYSVRGYSTGNCGNLYTLCLERSSALLDERGGLGVIVPLSGFSTERMQPYQDHIANRYTKLWLSYYSGDAHPSVMFDGVRYRLCIILGRNGKGAREIFTTDYIRWYALERPALFTKLAYAQCPFQAGFLRFAKIGNHLGHAVIRKMLAHKLTLGAYLKKAGAGHITYHRSPVFWIRSMDFEPYFKSPTKQRSTDHLKDLYLSNESTAQRAGGVLNSTCFYFWFTVQGNCRNVAGPDIERFSIGELQAQSLNNLPTKFAKLMRDLQRNSKRRVYVYEHSGKVEYDEFYPDLSKPIIDEIDGVLAGHYGLTAEELDFVPSPSLRTGVNYDISPRKRSGQATASVYPPRRGAPPGRRTDMAAAVAVPRRISVRPAPIPSSARYHGRRSP
jgi:hypothetical protein